MTKVQIDDFDCDRCEKVNMGEFDTRTRVYMCMVCGFSTHSLHSIKYKKGGVK